MGFARRLVRKSVRKATPRSVRRAMHPARPYRQERDDPSPREEGQPDGVPGDTPRRGGAERGDRCLALPQPQDPVHPQQKLRRRIAWTERRDRRAGGRGGSGRPGPAGLFQVRDRQFDPASMRLVAEPVAPDEEQMLAQAWLASGDTRPPVWKRPARRRLREHLAEEVARVARNQYDQARETAAAKRATAAREWVGLLAGDPGTPHAALTRAFQDAALPVRIIAAGRYAAEVAVVLPDVAALPAKQAHVTPTGRPSARAWPKGELHQTYADLIAEHLAAVARQAWATAPSLRNLTVLGLRGAATPDTATDTGPGPEVLFHATLTRPAHIQTRQGDAEHALATGTVPLRRVGRTRAVTGWVVKDLPPRTITTVRSAATRGRTARTG